MQRFVSLFLVLIAVQFSFDILDFILWNLYDINLYNISWASFPLDISKALAWYWVSFTGFQNARPERFLTSPPKRKVRYNISDVDLVAGMKVLDDYFEDQQPYLNPDFNLQVLASELDISTNKVSYILNEGKQLNFNEYVNEFRVNEVKQRLLDPNFANYTFLSIALDSGFNSKATFNRVFKAKTGLTPNQFVEKHR